MRLSHLGSSFVIVSSLAQSSSACESLSSQGRWDFVANGYEFVMHLEQNQRDHFSGTLVSSSEPTTSVDGRCDAASRRVSFERFSGSGSLTPQHYEGYMWQSEGITHVAGVFHVGSDTASKYGFHLKQIVEAPAGACDYPTFFHDDSFRGHARIYGRGTWIPDLTGDGDDFSSVCVPDGYKVEGFESNNFTGAKLTIFGPIEIPNLDNFDINGRQLRNWGDEIDSIMIE